METTRTLLDLGTTPVMGSMDKGIMDSTMAHQALPGLTLDAPCVTLLCTATATRNRLTMLAAAVTCVSLLIFISNINLFVNEKLIIYHCYYE